jgi:hypothetical protein
MRTLRLLAIVGAVLAVAVPAAYGTSPSPSAQSSAHQLWYRLSLNVTGSYDLQYRSGDKEAQTNGWNLTANTAILVKRICVLAGSPLSAADLALINGLNPNKSSCDDVRRAMSPNLRRQFGARLRDDFSVRANAKGTADTWTLTNILGERQVIQNGKTTVCPAGGRMDKQLSGPVKIVGQISGSARAGISGGFNFQDDNLAPATETRSAYTCTDDTGTVVAASAGGSRDVVLFADVVGGLYAPVHGGGNGGEFAYGPLGLEPVKVGNAGHLFGRSFTLTGGQPSTHQFSDGSSSHKSVSYQIRFELCPTAAATSGRADTAAVW